MMTDEEVLRTLQSMKPCVVNAEAQNEAIDRACEWGRKLQEIQGIIDKTDAYWSVEIESAFRKIEAMFNW